MSVRDRSEDYEVRISFRVTDNGLADNCPLRHGAAAEESLPDKGIYRRSIQLLSRPVSFYTGLIVDQVVRPVKDAFEKEYPFLQVEFFRANAERLAQRMLAEYQAKRYEVDIISGNL